MGMEAPGLLTFDASALDVPPWSATSADMGQLTAIFLDLAAGSVGGMAGVALGHPLDVVKTRMQANSSSLRALTMRECLSTTYRVEGVRGLWRGIAPPLFAVSLYQSTVFASYEWTYKQAIQADMSESRAQVVGGLVSGMASCFVTLPTDAVKIQLQLERGSSGGAVSDSFRALHRLTAERGALSLFRGLVPCMWRDVPTNVLYFSVYSNVKSRLQRILEPPATAAGAVDRGETKSPGWRGMVAELLAGGVAGTASWTVAVPADTIKTMAQEAAAAGRPSGCLAIMREVYPKEGLRGFCRGAGPIIVRAFPVNAVTFAVYEQCKRLFGVPSSL